MGDVGIWQLADQPWLHWVQRGRNDSV